MRPKKYKNPTTIRLEPEIKDLVDQCADKSGMKPVDWIRKAIDEKLERERVLSELDVTYDQNSDDVMRMLSVMDNSLVKAKIKAIVAED